MTRDKRTKSLYPMVKNRLHSLKFFINGAHQFYWEPIPRVKASTAGWQRIRNAPLFLVGNARILHWSERNSISFIAHHRKSFPVAAAIPVFLIYPIGQGSFSDGMHLGISFTFNFMIVFQAEHMLGVFGCSLFSAMRGNLWFDQGNYRKRIH